MGGMAGFGDVPLSGTVTITSASTGPCVYNMEALRGEGVMGGNTCHLCGARLVHSSVDTSHRARRMDEVFRRWQYKCGTVVSELNGKTKLARVGEKCIKAK